jgi:hypothetical protein
MQKTRPVTYSSASADKFRKALENSFGANIPKPKALSKETIQQHTGEMDADCETNLDDLCSKGRPKEVAPCSQETDKDMAYALEKIKGKERLSRDEFQRVYDIIWRRGPATKFQHFEKGLLPIGVREAFLRGEI